MTIFFALRHLLKTLSREDFADDLDAVVRLNISKILFALIYNFLV
jgi:hypothetical protein